MPCPADVDLNYHFRRRDDMSPEAFNALIEDDGRSAGASIVSAALRAVRCDAVVVTSASSDSPGEVVAALGTVDEQSRALREWLAALRGAFPADTGTIEFGKQEAAEQFGFRSVSAAPVRLGGQQLGVMYGLSTQPRTVDVGLLRAFASHYAVAVAHRPLRRGITVPLGRSPKTKRVEQLIPSVSGFPELITQISSLLSVIVGDVSCGVMVWDQERNVLQMVAGSFGASEAATASYQVNPGDLRSNAARVFELLCPYLTNHAVRDAALLQTYVEVFAIRRVLSIPLWVGDRVIGVLHVANKPADFTIADLEECERVGPGIALAVEMTWMLLRERRQKQFEATLSRVAQAVADGSATVRLLRGNLEELRKTVGASAIVLAPSTGGPIITTATGHISDDRFAAVIEEARGLQGERAHVVQPRGPDDPGSAAFHVPIRLGIRQLGTLSALRDRGERFDSDERLALARMANLTSMSWAAEAVSRQQTLLTRLEERHRIADDLHDDVAQLLFGADLQLDLVLERRDLDNDLIERASHARALVARADAAIRDLIHELSQPAAPASLPDQLSELAETIKQEFQMVVKVEISPEGRSHAERARESVKETLFRVARESLVNAGKHAGPCRCAVRLEAHDEQIVLMIVDDGVGVDQGDEIEHYGIPSLRRAAQRHGGSIEVKRGRVGGTVISAAFPL